MNKFAYRSIESMANGVLRSAYNSSGYKFRVIRWEGDQCETVAFFKTLRGAKQRVNRENIAFEKLYAELPV